MTTSPILPNFDPKMLSRASPAPPTAVPTRPAASRARNNSIASTLETSKQRPPSSASNKPNGAVPPAPDSASPAQNGSRAPADAKPPKETPVPVKVEAVAMEATPQPTVVVTNTHSRKNSVAKDDSEPKPETPQVTPTVTTVVTTKSGRASKPSTPALGSFPETVRSRSSRNTQAGGAAAKRSHKKGASTQPTIAVQAAAAADEDANSSVQGDDDGEIDANEPRYCYCNGVSYGEMVACDADDCEKEWFHLGCVGLRSAPSANSKWRRPARKTHDLVGYSADVFLAKWYCDNCKNRMKHGGKKVNGR